MTTDENKITKKLIDLINQIETMRHVRKAFLALSIVGAFAVIVLEGNFLSYILGWCLGALIIAANASVILLKTERNQIAEDIWDKA